MDTITSIEKIDTIKESVVTIGNFDGLHRGHQVLIKKATEYAKANNISSVVFTFKNHPVNYFRPGSSTISSAWSFSASPISRAAVSKRRDCPC